MKDTVIWNTELGLDLTAREIAEAQVARTALFRRVTTFLEEYEFLVLPVSQVPPFPVEVEWPTEIDGVQMETYIDWMATCYAITCTGLPAISVPCGFTQDGLPLVCRLSGAGIAILRYCRSPTRLNKRHNTLVCARLSPDSKGVYWGSVAISGSGISSGMISVEETLNMNNNYLRVTISVLLLCSSAYAVAHHSFAAQYDPDRPITLGGIVTKIEWTNPHARFYIDVEDDSGNVINWNLELASPNILVRNGWTRNFVELGDEVTVEGTLARDGSNMINALLVFLADGTQVMGNRE
ncbi:MAG: hypothetical protein CM1200mP36_11280 [Gammaproteobacteria bacterium]|nr:MAG: hypothetical protein CM1200mP36_11280 [Gammaproteobacteria bacterium]